MKIRSWFVQYWNVNKKRFPHNGHYVQYSSRFTDKVDAEHFLTATLEHNPDCTGQVLGSDHLPEIPPVNAA